MHIARRAFAINLCLLLPSTFAGWLVELINQPCNQQSGLLFMLLVAGGNVAFGTALGLFAGALTKRPRGALFVTLGILAVFVVITLSRLYSHPQIFAYSVPLGFWPGSLYDEELRVTGALWAFRGYTVLYVIAVLFAVNALTNDRALRLGSGLRIGSLMIAIGLGGATWAAYQAGDKLGFDLDEAAVQEALSLKLETEHFIIYAAPSLSQLQAERLKMDHELRWAQLERFFQVAPEGKITSYVYANVDDKARLMGAGRTQIARPWAKQIHIHGFEVPHRVLKHELAHIFAGSLARPPFLVPTEFGVLVNIGVVEGIAVAADWPSNELTVHAWTRAMRSLQLAPDMRKILSPMGFWSVSSGQAYTVAGSFIRFLVEQYGIEKFGVLYSANDFEAAYGKPLNALVTEWETFIDALPLPEAELVLAEHRFKRSSIFQKVCAHEAANLQRRGQQRLRAGDLKGGLQDLETLSGYRPKDPGPWVMMAEALAKQGQLDEAQVRVDKALAMEGATKKAWARAREAEGGIAWRRKQTRTASTAYGEVLALHLSTPSDRLQQARLTAIDGDAATQAVLRKYLLSEMPFSQALVRLGNLTRARPNDGLLHYLYGRALERAQAYPEGVRAMNTALKAGLPSGALQAEAELTAGRLLLWAGTASAAADRFEMLARRPISTAQQQTAWDWWARARFVADDALPPPRK
jgi:tetratricopeptide (TPR) repeat protein